VILLRVALVLAAAVAGGLAWPGALADRGFRPDFLLVAAVAGGVLGPRAAGAWTGIAGGLAAAPLTAEPFGFDAALLGAAGMAAEGLRGAVRADRATAQAVLAGVLALLVGVARVLRLEASGGGVPSLALLPAVLAGAIATAVAAPAAIFLLDGLRAFRVRERPGPAPVGLV
jgi:rod shape-determining protein MreD